MLEKQRQICIIASLTASDLKLKEPVAGRWFNQASKNIKTLEICSFKCRLVLHESSCVIFQSFYLVSHLNLIQIVKTVFQVY